jgi:hypothetical protein
LNNDPSTVVASSVNDEDQYERQNELPFFFISSFNRWFGSLLSQFVITTVPTNTIIFQQTITVTQTATVFNTVFVQRYMHSIALAVEKKRSQQTRPSRYAITNFRFEKTIQPAPA